jgi:hypothetical protein
MSEEREEGSSCIIRSNVVTKRNAFKFDKLSVTSVIPTWPFFVVVNIKGRGGKM